MVLNCPTGYRLKLDHMVEEFIADGVKFVGVVGVDYSRVEDIIDELVVGDGSDRSRYILTTSHPSESLDGAVEFARAMSGDYTGEPQIVER